ncbi:DUF2017 family protein [Microcella sp.]|uniref:DUF2017 family protein n=1 Tax=Microcella sp. TaxID=1913979 RepID=UPI00256DE621|nr:DUF2017 family protein [Microcella sp.]MBX9473038.1 DUF2017 domain-containing protein [Microcella sp.]
MKISAAEPDDDDSVIGIAVVEPAEASILVSLADQLQALLAESLESPVDTDSAVLRLLPDAYRSDPELADEWRRLSRRGLVDRKIGFAHSLSSALAPGVESDEARTVRLSTEVALDWVRGLGDLRLVIADRMGIVVDGDEGTFAEPGLRDVYDLLAWMQDALVQVLERAEQSSTSESS